jgi:hypothetical protein
MCADDANKTSNAHSFRYATDKSKAKDLHPGLFKTKGRAKESSGGELSDRSGRFKSPGEFACYLLLIRRIGNYAFIDKNLPHRSFGCEIEYKWRGARSLSLAIAGFE